MDIEINYLTFKQYRDTQYYVSEFGDVFSGYSNKLLKPLWRHTRGKTYYCVDVTDPITHKQRHTNIHKMVWEAWKGPVPEGYQINHTNDNSMDNSLDNLYLGTQKENIRDQFKNNHRIGVIKYLIVYDKLIGKELCFCPAIKFTEYCGHTASNGGISRLFTRDWFKERYEVIEYRQINNLFDYRSVTTMGDECNPVE